MQHLYEHDNRLTNPPFIIIANSNRRLTLRTGISYRIDENGEVEPFVTPDGEEDNWVAEYNAHKEKYGDYHDYNAARRLIRIDKYLHTRDKDIVKHTNSPLYKKRIGIFDMKCQRALGAYGLLSWYIENGLSHLARGFSDAITMTFCTEFNNGLHYLIDDTHGYLEKDLRVNAIAENMRQNIAIDFVKYIESRPDYPDPDAGYVRELDVVGRLKAHFTAWADWHEYETRNNAREVWLETAERQWHLYNRVSEKKFYTAPNENVWTGLDTWYFGDSVMESPPAGAVVSTMNTPDPTVGSVARAGLVFTPNHPEYQWQSFTAIGDDGVRKSPPTDSLEGITNEGKDATLTLGNKFLNKVVRRITYYVDDDGYSERIAISPWSNPVVASGGN